MHLIDLVGIIAGLAALVGGWLARRHGLATRGDRKYAGLVPGLSPVAGQPAAVEPATGGEYAGEIPVAFTPPRDVAPGVGGVVVDEGAEARDVTGTVLDLAVRGWLTVRAVDAGNGRRDWELTRADQPPEDTLRPFEARLYAELFRDDPVTTLGDVARRPDRPLARTRDDLLAEAWQLRWYEHLSAAALVRYGLVAAAVVAALVVMWLGGGLLPGLLFVVGAVVAATGYGPRDVRSAAGTAARVQLLGFRKYLATAEADQFTFEEAAGIFSRYLPWAIVFGVAEHWAKVFADIATAARDEDVDVDLGLGGFGAYVAADLLGDIAFAGMLTDLDALGGLDDLGAGIGDATGGDFFGDGGPGDGGGFDPGSFFGGGGDGGGFDLGGGDGGGFDFGGFD